MLDSSPIQSAGIAEINGSSLRSAPMYDAAMHQIKASTQHQSRHMVLVCSKLNGRPMHE